MIKKLTDWFERHKNLSVFFLIISLIIVLYPRFNRHDIAIIRPFVGLQQGEVSFDVKYYINFTEYFKRNMPIDSVMIPYSYRPAVPFLASLVPTNSLLGIITVSIIALLLSVVSIFFILKKENFSFGFRIIGCLLFIISFPVFYYVSSGYIDSTALLIICLIVLATVYRKYFALLFLFLAGALIKEVIIIALPFVLFSYYQHRPKSKNKIVKVLMLLALCLSFYFIGYTYSRQTFAVVRNFVWSPGLSSMLENAKRSKTYFSFILSFGIVGILALMQFILDCKVFSTGKNSVFTFFRSYHYSPYVSGILASLLLCAYAVVAAYADGRFIWTAYPFLIPLAVKYLHDRTVIIKPNH